MPTQPRDRRWQARFVAPPGCAIEQLVRDIEGVEAPGVTGVGVIDDAAVQGKRAEARALRSERLAGEVVDGVVRHRAGPSWHVPLRRSRRVTGERDAEVVVE